jgi:phosphoribosyl-ATP pyrophosphohydrolase
VTDLQKPDLADVADPFDLLMQTIVARRDNPLSRSYTRVLLAGGDPLIGDKILEEAAEVVDAAKRLTQRTAVDTAHESADGGADDRRDTADQADQAKQADGPRPKVAGSREHLIHEAADLVYHLWVMLARHHVSLDELRSELARRSGVSGLDEKANRTTPTPAVVDGLP